MAKSKPEYITHFITTDGKIISLVLTQKFYQIREQDKKILLISYDLKHAQAEYDKLKLSLGKSNPN